MLMTLRALVIVSFMGLAGSAHGQDTVKVVTYNLLNYTTSDVSRDPYYRTVVRNISPDVLVLQELTSLAALNQFYTNVVNVVFPGQFTQGTFVDGPDSDNGIFVRTAKFTFLDNNRVRTALRDISEFKLFHPASAETLRVYSVHLKSSTGSANEAARAAEADSLRNVTNRLPAGKHFMVVGDFNIYGSTEPAYQKLLQTNPSDDGRFIDPITLAGTWNSSAYAIHHTQSTRTRSFGGGATGGLDDRFDMILFSSAINAGSRVKYISGSMVAYGNSGFHYDDSVNAPRGTPPVAADSVAHALHYASDHLPVSAQFVFQPAVVPVQLASFSATLNVRADSVVLRWRTLTETNNFGFEIERRSASGSFAVVAGSFVPGNGTTITPHTYSFHEPAPGTGTWHYRLKQIDLDGTVHYSESVMIDIVTTVASATAPTAFSLGQNYPNPFNPVTTIPFAVTTQSHATLRVFDMLGQELVLLFDGNVEEGWHKAVFSAEGLSSGVYFYRLDVTTPEGASFSRMMRMTLLR